MSSSQRARFVAEYLVDFNATRAAIRAGYSPRSAHAQGCRLLKYPDVKQAIDDRIMGPNEVLVRTTDIARADINVNDFIVKRTATVVDNKGKSHEIEFYDLNQENFQRYGRLIKKLSWSRSGAPIIELYDSQAALVTLGKYHKLFADRSELTGPDGGPIQQQQTNVLIYIPDNGREPSK